MHDLALEGHLLHAEQTLHDVDVLPHLGDQSPAFDALLPGQRVPVGTEAAEYAVGRQLVQRREGQRHERRPAGPSVHNARPQLDPRGDGGHRAQYRDSVTSQARLADPDRLESQLVRSPRQAQLLAQIRPIEETEAYPIHGFLLPSGNRRSLMPLARATPPRAHRQRRRPQPRAFRGLRPSWACRSPPWPVVPSKSRG